MGRSRDLLLTPYFVNKTKTLQYRYRQALTNGDIICGGLSQDELFGSNLRVFGHAEVSAKLGFGVHLDLSSGLSSDSAYLLDYGFNDADYFDTELSLSKSSVQPSNAYSVKLGWTRDIEDGIVNDDHLYFWGLFEEN